MSGLSDAALTDLFGHLSALAKPGLVHLHIPKSGGTALVKAFETTDRAFLNLAHLRTKRGCANPTSCRHRKCRVAAALLTRFLDVAATKDRWVMHLGHRPFSSELFASMPDQGELLFMMRQTERRFVSLLRFHSQTYAFVRNSLKIPVGFSHWWYFAPRFTSPIESKSARWSRVEPRHHRRLAQMRRALRWYFDRTGRVKNPSYFTRVLTGQPMLYADLLPSAIFDHLDDKRLLILPTERLDAFMAEVLGVTPVRDNVSRPSGVSEADEQLVRQAWRESQESAREAAAWQALMSSPNVYQGGELLRGN